VLNRVQIPATIALVVGVVMAIASMRLPLHQNDVTQTSGEFAAYLLLSVGGVLIAIVGAFGLGWSSRKL
jgi:hypothetical protein